MKVLVQHLSARSILPGYCARAACNSAALPTAVRAWVEKRIAARTAAAIGICAVLLGSAGHALADAITLTSNNSTVVIDPASSAVDSWTVGGLSQLTQQSFWYRIGSGPGAASQLNTLGTPVISGTSASTSTTAYSGLGLSVSAQYALTGFGSASSDLNENIGLHNTGSSSISLSFFSYANFALLGSSSANLVQFPDGFTVDVTNSGSSAASSETTQNISTPAVVANFREANQASVLLSELGSGTLTTLSGSNSISSPPSGIFGPGNIAWAYEWDVTLAPGSSALITVDMDLANVPEPSIWVSALSGSLAFVGLTLRGARRRLFTTTCLGTLGELRRLGRREIH